MLPTTKTYDPFDQQPSTTKRNAFQRCPLRVVPQRLENHAADAASWYVYPVFARRPWWKVEFKTRDND